ncbi:MAG: PEP-CTERM sorting domain-containing protein [Opitutales bacterium]
MHPVSSPDSTVLLGRATGCRFLAVSLLFLLSGAFVSLPASVVNLTFTGTVDTDSETVFGETGSAVPFSFSMTYDTSLDTNTTFVAQGDNMGSSTLENDFYGYSASGITAVDLSFGTGSWASGDLNARIPEAGFNADFWADTDLAIATPTRVWIYFSNGDGVLELGGGSGGGGTLRMDAGEISIEDDAGDSSGFSSNLSIGTAAIPEPRTYAVMAGLLVLGLAMRRRRRKV